MANRKPLPPYGKRAASNPDAHQVGLYVYTGENAWDAAKEANQQWPAVALPDQEHPASFRWPVKGFTVTILRMSPLDAEIQMSLARELLKAGAIQVFACLSGPLVHFTAEANHAR